MKQTKVATVNVDRNPQVGDVLKINNKNLVVVSAGRDVSEDRARGDSYFVDYFDTINEADLGFANPNIQHFILEGGSMGKANAKLVRHDEIELVRSRKLQTETVVTYNLK